MTIRTLALIGALVAAAPVPALAADPSCAIQLTTPELRADLGKAMTTGEGGNIDSLSLKLGTATDTCAKAAGFSDAQYTAYYELVLSEIARRWLSGELGKSGLDAAVIDKALDFGAGRANPVLKEDISEEQIGQIISGFLDAGVDIEKVSQAAWELAGSYAAATSLYWEASRQLP